MTDTKEAIATLKQQLDIARLEMNRAREAGRTEDADRWAKECRDMRLELSDLLALESAQRKLDQYIRDKGYLPRCLHDRAQQRRIIKQIRGQCGCPITLFAVKFVMEYFLPYMAGQGWALQRCRRRGMGFERGKGEK